MRKQFSTFMLVGLFFSQWLGILLFFIQRAIPPITQLFPRGVSLRAGAISGNL